MESVDKKTLNNYYRLTNDSINNLLIDLIDAGYTIDIARGFVLDKIVSKRKDGAITYEEHYTDKLLMEKTKTSYRITIYSKNSNFSDVKDSLITIIDYLNNKGFNTYINDDFDDNDEDLGGDYDDDMDDDDPFGEFEDTYDQY